MFDRAARLLADISALVLFIFFANACVADQTQWPTERGGVASQGRSASKMPAQPVELWSYAVDGAEFSGTPIVAMNRVYLADFQGTLHCVSLTDGSLIWKKDLKTGFLVAAAFQDGKLVLPDYDGIVHCLDAATGEPTWTFETGGQIDAGANFYKDITLVTSEDGFLYALGLNDGVLRWKYETGDQLRCSPTVAGNLTFLGGCDRVLHIVDLDKGTSTGAMLPLDAPTGSTPAVLGDLAVVPTHSGVVTGYDWRAAKQLWQFTDTEITQEIKTSPAISDTDVFLTPQNKRVIALNKDSGKLKWEYVLRKRADSSPVYADGRVWITGIDGQLIALDAATGELVWNEQRTGKFTASPAIAEQRLIVASEKGVLYCFGAKE